MHFIFFVSPKTSFLFQLFENLKHTLALGLKALEGITISGPLGREGGSGPWDGEGGSQLWSSTALCRILNPGEEWGPHSAKPFNKHVSSSNTALTVQRCKAQREDSPSPRR